jgi:hypothetical protein
LSNPASSSSLLCTYDGNFQRMLKLIQSYYSSTGSHGAALA